jgi:AAA domain, putative AbiEii toxin, Type IV TA system
MTFEPSYLANQIEPAGRQGSAQNNFLDSYRRYVITRIQAYFLARGSIRGAQLPGKPEDLEELLSTVLPDFMMTLNGGANPPYELRRSINNAKVENVNQLSSGEAQILTVALDCLTIAAIWDMQGTEDRLLLIDEPDAHIHPDLQARFADFIVRLAERFKCQIAIATHSTTLLAALGQFGGSSASIIYLDRTNSEFPAKPFSKEVKELTACLGGHALMGPLFGVPLLLVEGDDDYRIWSQVPRHHVVAFSVIPTNGDEIMSYQKSLETVLGALSEPGSLAGFALLDGDKALPQPSANSPQEQIKFIKLDCHEAENLFLTDEVLALLETNWPAAQAKIFANAANYGQKAAILANAINWDRKTVDIHEVINQITQILDPKNVHWTIRVAKAIGVTRPTGTLLDFLSVNVVNALWGAAPAPAALATAAPAQ